MAWHSLDGENVVYSTFLRGRPDSGRYVAECATLRRQEREGAV
jgi:hypothetical protein